MYSDLTDLDLPPGSFDAIRTERGLTDVAARGEFVATFTGILTAATRPPY